MSGARCDGCVFCVCACVRVLVSTRVARSEEQRRVPASRPVSPCEQTGEVFDGGWKIIRYLECTRSPIHLGRIVDDEAATSGCRCFLVVRVKCQMLSCRNCSSVGPVGSSRCTAKARKQLEFLHFTWISVLCADRTGFDCFSSFCRIQPPLLCVRACCVCACARALPGPSPLDTAGSQRARISSSVFVTSP